MALLALLVLSRRRELILLREQIADAMALEAHQRVLLATAPPAGSAVAAAGVSSREPATAIYRAQKGRRRVILAGGVVVSALLLAAVLREVLPAGLVSSSAPQGSPISVAVFNATHTQGVARGIANELKAGRMRIGQIGDISANLGTGVYVLYPPGAQARARQVAKLISNLSPTVEPIQPKVQSAVTQHDEIVVIFD